MAPLLQPFASGNHSCRITRPTRLTLPQNVVSTQRCPHCVTNVRLSDTASARLRNALGLSLQLWTSKYLSPRSVTSNCGEHDHLRPDTALDIDMQLLIVITPPRCWVSSCAGSFTSLVYGRVAWSVSSRKAPRRVPCSTWDNRRHRGFGLTTCARPSAMRAWSTRATVSSMTSNA